MSTEPNETIDVRNNPESKAAAANAPSAIARASDGGAPPKEAPPAGEMPETAESGTAAGSPVAGLEIDDETRHEAVSGDTGPTELGEKGPDLNG